VASREAIGSFESTLASRSKGKTVKLWDYTALANPVLPKKDK
jgi:hypothetical protein